MTQADVGGMAEVEPFWQYSIAHFYRMADGSKGAV